MVTKICKHPACPSLGKPQDVSNFCRDRSRADGLHPYCRDCRTRIAAERMARSEEARERARQATQRYYDSAAGREHSQRYYREHKAEYRARERKYSQRPDVRARLAIKQAAYRERNHDKECARWAARRALITGYLKSAGHCEWCGGLEGDIPLEMHHWRGYAPEHWLDVKFVHADPCHSLCENVKPEFWPA